MTASIYTPTFSCVIRLVDTGKFWLGLRVGGDLGISWRSVGIAEREVMQFGRPRTVSAESKAGRRRRTEPGPNSIPLSGNNDSALMRYCGEGAGFPRPPSPQQKSPNSRGGSFRRGVGGPDSLINKKKKKTSLQFGFC